MPIKNMTPEYRLILEARHHDPFSFLGLHENTGNWIVRVFRPYASEIWLHTGETWEPLKRVHKDGFFTWEGAMLPPTPCKLRFKFDEDFLETHDPYTFGSSIGALDLHLFGEGRLHLAYRTLGAHPMMQDGISGTRFAVWAPNAERVSVVGDFNGWDGRAHPMRVHASNGVWEIFLPGIGTDALYKFEIRNRNTGDIFVKTDPYGVVFEARPGTAARICNLDAYVWEDEAWMARRKTLDWLHAPMNVYEIHAGSWKLLPDGRTMNYWELAQALI